MPKRKSHPSGWYRSKQGNAFHALGNNMSQETIDALGAMADLVKENINNVCPTCGNKWLHGLEWHRERGWYCTCGWTGDEPTKASE